MMYLMRFLLVVSFLGIPVFSTLHAQTAQEYYKQGIELKKQNQIDEAIEAFQKAVEKDSKFAEAYYELALVYQSKKTPAALKRAEDAILAAKKYGSDDVKYLSALALIYEDRLMFSETKTTWERVLEIDPENIEALAGMARFYAREEKNDRYRVEYDLEWKKHIEPEILKLIQDDVANYAIDAPLLWDKNMLEYLGNSMGVFITPKTLENFLALVGVGEVRWDEFAAVDDSMARSFNERILEINPDDRDALYRQGLLYFDKVKFQERVYYEQEVSGYIPDSEHLVNFAKLFEKQIINHPEDKDGHLFLGLAYHRMHDYDKAFEQYETAKGLMSDEERYVFSNVGYLKVGGLKETEIQSIDSDTSKFWYQRDPLFLTPYNERQLEHYSRVAEANLRFSVPREEVEGWKTDRGKIFIKYGMPETRKVFVDNDQWEHFQEFEDKFFKYDLWYFDDFSFSFETSCFDEKDNYKLSTNIIGLNFTEITTDIEKVYPEYYEYEPKGLFIGFPFDVATFRGEKGRTRMEVYYGVPFNMVRFEEEGEYYYGNYETGAFLHDMNWNRVLEDVQYKDLQFAVTKIDTSSDDIAVDRFVYQVEPHSYHFAIEMLDMYSDNAGTYKDILTTSFPIISIFNVEEYGNETLQISDIQLASNITIPDPAGAVTRENLEITPNPPRFYRANQPIYIYYEIYNLLLNDIPGNTDYTVEYNIDYIGEDKYSIVDYVRNLIVNEKQELGVTTIFTRSGIDRDETSFLRLDHNLTKPGPYRLTLKVTDNIAKNSVEKYVRLRLFEDK
ncbi:hypothetical protein AMJ80_02780 [bacterium SM23_31]|nr:MAG: hypothetical protein AMJ80_02780 [bacterium SM23_31]